MASVFQTPSPGKATRGGQAVTPMSGPQTPVQDREIAPGSVRHVPAPKEGQGEGGR